MPISLQIYLLADSRSPKVMMLAMKVLFDKWLSGALSYCNTYTTSA
jgi:hypothetical protein